MGRKTNSVSLRLKNTNRDYNHCWYGDILYADTFSKSLKVQYYLSQTLKTIDMPCPQTSVIGAFKKANLLVCYLDPKNRKRLLEKYLKGPIKPIAFVSLRQKDQDSKALLNPLEGGLGTRFSRSLLLGKPQSQKDTSVALLDNVLFSALYEGLFGAEGDLRAITKISDQSISFPKKEEKINIKIAKEKQIIVNNFLPRSLGLDLSKRILGLAGVTTNQQLRTCDLLKNKRHNTPYIFENSFETIKILFRINYLSDWILRDKKQPSQTSTFNQNIMVFGKQNSLGFNSTSFYCSENFLKNKTSKENNLLEKKLFYVDKKSNLSLNILYGFYNGFSHFMENAVCLSFYKATNETSCALFLADTVSYLLERKVLFRSIKRQLLLELNQPKKTFLSAKEFPKFGISGAFENKKRVTGIRISCSGRVGGRSKKAQRSRKDTFMWGDTGLHVFSSKLDFAKTHAETPFGVVGVQVWVCTK